MLTTSSLNITHETPFVYVLPPRNSYMHHHCISYFRNGYAWVMGSYTTDRLCTAIDHIVNKDRGLVIEICYSST